MESISQIRNRINPNKKGKRIINIFIFIFTLLSFSLGFMIYCRVDEDAKYINSILGTNINFEEFNNTINNIFSFNKDIVRKSPFDLDILPLLSFNHSPCTQ